VCVLLAVVLCLLIPGQAKASGFSFLYDLPVSFDLRVGGLSSTMWPASGDNPQPLIHMVRPLGSNVFQGQLVNSSTGSVVSRCVLSCVGDPTSNSMKLTVLDWGGSPPVVDLTAQTMVPAVFNSNSGLAGLSAADSGYLGMVCSGALWVLSGSSVGGSLYLCTVENVQWDDYRYDNAFLPVIVGFMLGFFCDWLSAAFAMLFTPMLSAFFGGIGA
jgi:hypothetical protein